MNPNPATERIDVRASQEEQAREGQDREPALHVSAREFLESVPDAVVGVNGEGSIAFVNLQAEKVFGYGRTEMLGQRVELLLPDRLKQAHAAHRAGYLANPTTRPMGVGLDLVARRKDGTEFPVEISLSPLRTVEGFQIISVVRDVTERREIEKERERVAEVAERARSEAEAALRIRERAERLKDDLFNMVVHDLKSPVNGIAMTVQLLLRKGQLSEIQRDGLARTDRTCRELLRLIGNILDIAKIEAGEMPVAAEPLVLAAIVDEVAAEYGFVATQLGRRLSITVGTDIPLVVADRALLKRVLVNLLANALRHSGSADVCIEAAPEAGTQEVSVRVVDHGHGISEGDRASVFEKFKTPRGDPTGDTGLGLPFCKLAVERMRGHIELRSAPGAGTTFTVTLPSASA